MKKRLSNKTREELISALRKRYIKSSKRQKTKIINEFIEITNYHRKHVIRLLTEKNKVLGIKQPKKSNRIYTEAVKEALIFIWEAADRICSRRLKAAIPIYIESLELHHHFDIDQAFQLKSQLNYKYKIIPVHSFWTLFFRVIICSKFYQFWLLTCHKVLIYDSRRLSHC